MPPKTKIFVGKLPPTIEQNDLRKLFERYGEVTECSILGNYAFIHMKTEEEAETAINKLNNWEIDGSKISVEQSTGEKRSGGGGYGRGRGGGGGGGGGFYGGGAPMRGRGMGPRPGPYDRRPPMGDRYGPAGPPPPMRNGFFDDYDRRERRPLPPVGPMERRPQMIPRETFRDPYDRYDPYERILAPMGRRTPPPLERRPPPLGYDRREDPYDSPYSRDRELYARDIYGPRRSPPRGLSPPRRYPGPLRDMPLRRF